MKEIKELIGSIDIPDELHAFSLKGIQRAKAEQRATFNKSLIGIAASLLLLISTVAIYNLVRPEADPSVGLPNAIEHEDQNQEPKQYVAIPKLIEHEDDSITLATMELPTESNMVSDMIGLIVYDGKIYTHTTSQIDPAYVEAIKGDWLGTTKATIDEWSDQSDYTKEFASSIGVSEVYNVKGYEEDFRIMAYRQHDNKVYANLYECFQGIRIYSGADIIGKLNVVDRINHVQYRSFNDWNDGIDNFKSIEDIEVVNDFFITLNDAKPMLRTSENDPISINRNDEQFRELTVMLDDGAIATMKLLKDGYIYYGRVEVYFEMDQDAFSKMWQLME